MNPEVKKHNSGRLPLKGAILSLFLALAFIAVAFSPVAEPVKAETNWGAVGLGVAGGAATGA
jgi:hypothetical protein